MIDRDTAIENETLTGPFAGVIWHILKIFENAALQVIDLVNPRPCIKALAFSQRIPPVQYIASFFGLLSSSRLASACAQAGKSRKFVVLGSTAPSNMPIAVS